MDAGPFPEKATRDRADGRVVSNDCGALDVGWNRLQFIKHCGVACLIQARLIDLMIARYAECFGQRLTR